MILFFLFFDGLIIQISQQWYDKEGILTIEN